jgi:hypothetical protein
MSDPPEGFDKKHILQKCSVGVIKMILYIIKEKLLPSGEFKSQECESQYRSHFYLRRGPPF